MGILKSQAASWDISILSWQRAENPSIHKFLQLPGEPRGVLISEHNTLDGKPALLKPRDILLKVDGHEIDTEGFYTDPQYGVLMLENLATCNKMAGDHRSTHHLACGSRTKTRICHSSSSL